MDILLHVCCAPCSIYPIESIKGKAHRVAGYFYNPNIHLYSEYLKRMLGAQKYFKAAEINLLTGDYELEKYFQFITYNEAQENRCPTCWWMRLERTAKHAKENGFEAFTTTLLGSPYQDHDIIKEIAGDVASKAAVKFYYEDFRIGFKNAYDKAKAIGIYRQNYCGCIFSEKERLEKKASGKAARKKR